MASRKRAKLTLETSSVAFKMTPLERGRISAQAESYPGVLGCSATTHFFVMFGLLATLILAGQLLGLPAGSQLILSFVLSFVNATLLYIETLR